MLVPKCNQKQNILIGLDNNNKIMSIFFDITRAFETVNHQKLLNCVENTQFETRSEN